MTTVTAVIVTAILVILAGTATADIVSPPTDTTTTVTQPVDTTTEPTDTTLQLKKVRVQIVLYRQSAWHWQNMLGQRLSPGGNFWNLGNLQSGTKTLQVWKTRSHQLHLTAKRVMRQRIRRYSQEVSYMSRVMGLRPARILAGSSNIELRFSRAKKVWMETHGRFSNPPQKGSFLCIHGHEGSWTDQDSGHNGHYGGVQMGPHEWMTFGYPYTGKLWAYLATPLEQLWAAYRYWRVSGFRPWSQTAPLCGLPV